MDENFFLFTYCYKRVLMLCVGLKNVNKPKRASIKAMGCYEFQQLVPISYHSRLIIRVFLIDKRKKNITFTSKTDGNL